MEEAEDNVLYQKLCRLRELFSGRFSTDEVAAILTHNNNHLDASVVFILSNEPEVIRQFLETERNSWHTIEQKSRRMKQNRQSGILDRARSGSITTDARLYACTACDSFWWRLTPQRKKVSRCHRCRKRYDPVPRDREWGWAEFKCNHHDCGREFGGWCAIYMTSPCYGCGRLIYPTRICPPSDRSRNASRNRTLHSCAAPDCPGRHHHAGPVGDPTMTCVHPQSRRLRGLPTVINPSNIHDSTGSTVDTFLSQTNLSKQVEEFFPSLPSVPEHHEDSDEANAGSDKGEP